MAAKNDFSDFSYLGSLVRIDFGVARIVRNLSPDATLEERRVTLMEASVSVFQFL